MKQKSYFNVFSSHKDKMASGTLMINEIPGWKATQPPFIGHFKPYERDHSAVGTLECAKPMNGH